MRSSLLVLGLLAPLAGAACSGGGGGVIGAPGSTGTGETPPSTESNPDGTSLDGKTIPKAVTAKLAADLTINEIAVFQAVKATIVKDGEAVTSKVPLVAAREAVVRVYVTPSDNYEARPIKGVLRVLDENGTALKAITDQKTIKSKSTDGSLASTFNFRIPGGSLPLGAKFAVALTDDAATPVEDGAESEARFPKNGSEADLDLKSAGPSLKVVIVPVKYTADGSGRLPDTSQAQLDIMHDAMWTQYPVPEVDISVRAPFTWSRSVKGNGTGWGALLQALVDLREQDGADDDVYYWGAFSAASSSQAFCGGGCVAGLSTLVDDPRNAYFRASIGMGFTGPESAETMVHEIGHAHGRNHAPCTDFGDIDGVDSKFPHTNGSLGVWGMNLKTDKLYSPTTADFMGYCNPTFVSDYTYKGLFDRVAAVNQGKALPPVDDGSGSGGENGSFQFVELDAEGPISFGRKVNIRRPPVGAAREVHLLAEGGKTIKIVRAQFFPYDHLPGGSLLLPETGVAYHSIRVAGSAKTLAR